VFSSQPLLLEVVEEPAHVVVDRLDALQVVAHVDLVLPAHARLAVRLPAQMLGNLRLEVLGPHVVGDRHVHPAHGLRARLEVVEEGLRLRDRAVGVEVGVLLVGDPWTMRRLVVHHHRERGVGGGLLVDPVDRQVGDDFRRVAGDGRLEPSSSIIVGST
jgi:hypothetical protein